MSIKNISEINNLVGKTSKKFEFCLGKAVFALDRNSNSLFSRNKPLWGHSGGAMIPGSMLLHNRSSSRKLVIILGRGIRIS